MENMDILDAYTHAGGDIMHAIPPYVGGGYCGRTLRLNRTEEVRGSSPLRSTHEPPYVGFFNLSNLFPVTDGFTMVHKNM